MQFTLAFDTEISYAGFNQHIVRLCTHSILFSFQIASVSYFSAARQHYTAEIYNLYGQHMTYDDVKGALIRHHGNAPGRPNLFVFTIAPCNCC